ncbi:MAG TPA: hypothetical protein VII00_07155 [bacterium]
MDAAKTFFKPVESLSTPNAPKLSLPFRYLITGMTFLIAGVLLIVIKPEIMAEHYIRSPFVLGLAHIFALGFITMIMLGAMFQFIPVIAETSLFSEPLGKLNYWVFLSGLIGTVFSFILKQSYLGIFTGIVSLSLLIFLFNISATIVKSIRRDIVIWHVIAGCVFLFATAILGPLLGANLKAGFIRNPLSLIFSHFILSALGWITITTMGVSYQLIPMFILSHNFPTKYASLSILSITAGTLGLAISPLFKNTQGLGFISLLLILSGVILYLIQMAVIFRARMRKKIDTAIYGTIIAKSMLALATITGTVVFLTDAPFQWHYLPSILLLLGFAGLYIMGMMHKIVPFLVWYNKYSSKIGIEKVPMTKDMVSEPLIQPILYFWTGGIAGISIGAALSNIMLIRFSALAMLFGAVLFFWNIANVFRK